MTKRLHFNHCFGDYAAGDPTCDGGEGDAPCFWRNNCVAFRIWMDAKGKSKTDLMAFDIMKMPDGTEKTAAFLKVDQAAFIKTMDAIVKTYCIVNGRAMKEKKETPSKTETQQGDENKPGPKKGAKPTKQAQKKARAAVMANKDRKREACGELFEHFKRALLEALPGYQFTNRQSAIAPARLYMVNRLNPSGYVSIYCRSKIRKDAAVASVRFKPASITLDITIPVPIEEVTALGKTTIEKLKPHRVLDGHFLTRFPKADKERSAMVAEIIGKLAKEGKIELPEVTR